MTFVVVEESVVDVVDVDPVVELVPAPFPGVVVGA
jgi:hypothetical protein